MPSSPHRSAAGHPSKQKKVESVAPIDDRDLLPVFAIVWLFMVFRVVIGLAHGETFGAELTLALGAVITLPALAKQGLCALWLRSEQNRSDHNSP
jgi:hypothetical protein